MAALTLAPTPNLNFLLLGDAGVGKFQLVWRYMKLSCVDINLKFEFESRPKRLLLRNKGMAFAWDNRVENSALNTSFFREAHGIIIVYDVTNRDSFNSVTEWMAQVRRYASSTTQILLVANKIDLVEDDEYARWYVTDAEGAQKALEFNVPFASVSASKGTYVLPAFDELIRSIYTHLPIDVWRARGFPVLLHRANAEKQYDRGCC